ncbi:MAG: helix-turn-helix transcriptional regulator [Armatimonadetes bacterium]|nr:helix-turn-helix transcriptional regulator [Armatimonadota bacterium]
MNINDLAKLIKERRKTLEINQQEFCEISDISHHTLSDIESGKGNPTFSILNKIFDVLGLEMRIKIKGSE